MGKTVPNMGWKTADALFLYPYGTRFDALGYTISIDTSKKYDFLLIAAALGTDNEEIGCSTIVPVRNCAFSLNGLGSDWKPGRHTYSMAVSGSTITIKSTGGINVNTTAHLVPAFIYGVKI